MTNYFSIGCSLTVPLNDARVLRLKSYAEAAATAGAIVLDLEDSVPAQEKAAARDLFLEAFDYFSSLNKNVFCRINGGTQYLKQDLEICARKPLTGLQIPKVSGVADVEIVQMHLRELKVSKFDLVPIIETLNGIKNLEAIIAKVKPPCLYFGSEDISFELGVEPSAESLWYVAHQVLFEAARAQIPVFGLLGPYCYYTHRDAEIFKSLLALSKRMGFQGAPAVHPRQVKIIREHFRVTEAEKDLLKKLTEREKRSSVFSVEGLMYGPPMIKRLRQRIERE
jgi:citrate lyase subunit beta/citryl-CoA lyase